MFITVHLAATALSGGLKVVDSGLQQTLAELGVKLEPLHPGLTDPDLAGQFYAAVDDATADQICDRLLEHSAVVAAYPKPAGSPPSAGEL